MDSNCQRIIDAARAHEKEYTENLIFLLDDRELCRALVAWKNARTTIVEPDEPQKAGEDDWQYLWRWCRYDQKQYGAMSGLQQQKVTQVIAQLKDLHLIYPDGSVNTMAKHLIGSFIKKEIEKYADTKKKE